MTHPFIQAPSAQNALSYLQTSGVSAFISGVSSGQFTPMHIDMGLSAIGHVLENSGFTSGPNAAVQLLKTLQSVPNMRDTQRMTTMPGLLRLMGECELDIEVALADRLLFNSQRALEVANAASHENVRGDADAGGAEERHVVRMINRQGDGLNNELPTVRALDSGTEGLSIEHPAIVSERELALHLTRAIAVASSKANVFVSPFAISQSLKLLANAASGHTLDELSPLVGLDEYGSVERMNAANRVFRHLLAITDPEGVTFNVASAMLLNSDAVYGGAFVETVRDVFEGEVFPMHEVGVDRFNDWVRNKTGGMIENAMDRDSISRADDLALASAVYFDGIWSEGFDEQFTRPMTFRTSHDGDVEVPMMIRKSLLRYHSGEFGKMVELPYGNGEYSMALFLPSGEPMTFLKFMYSGFAMDIWLNYLAACRVREGETEVALKVPRFKSDYRIELSAAFRALGLHGLFESQSDFSRAISSTGDGHRLRRVTHSTAIEVDEKGTRAAAYLGSLISTIGRPPEMTLDKPFFYSIQHAKTALPLFMGWMDDPSRSG